MRLKDVINRLVQPPPAAPRRNAVDSLVIGPRVYRVVTTRLIDGWGEIDHNTLEVYIDEGIEADAIADEFLVHESLHGLLETSGGGEVLPSADREEQLVRCLAPALVDWMRRNPGLIENIMEAA